MELSLDMRMGGAGGKRTNGLLPLNLFHYDYETTGWVDSGVNAWSVTNPGSVNSPSVVAGGKIGNAVELDQAQFDHIKETLNTAVGASVRTTIGALTAFTANFWINIPTGSSGNCGIVGFGDNFGTVGWHVRITITGSERFDVYMTTIKFLYAAASGFAVDFDTWTMYTVVYNGTNPIKLYRNAVLVFEDTNYTPPSSIGTPADTEGWYIAGNPVFDALGAKMDLYAGFNAALSLSQIQALYNGGNGLAYSGYEL